jgi:hypothetical protein
VAVAVSDDRTTTEQPKLHQAHQRLVTAIQGAISLNLTGLTEQGARLGAAISCDAQQATELAELRVCLTEIIAIGHADCANLARVGVVRWDRAAEWDRTRDEHVSFSARLGSVMRRGLLRAAGIIEQVLTGRPS